MTLLELFQLLKKHLQLVITLPVVCAIAMGIVSFVAMDNTYTATTSMYILAKTDDSGQMSYNDLSASQMLSNDIATLLDSDSVKSGAANELGLTDLDDYKVSVSSETTTRVITLSVTGTDAKETAKVAKAMASSVSTVAQNVGAAQSINVIDEAKTPEVPSGPKRMPVSYTHLRTAGPIVADGVACQIIDELVDQARHAFDDHRLGLMTYRHIRLTGDLFKTLLNRVDGTREPVSYTHLISACFTSVEKSVIMSALNVLGITTAA